MNVYCLSNSQLKVKEILRVFGVGYIFDSMGPRSQFLKLRTGTQRGGILTRKRYTPARMAQ